MSGEQSDSIGALAKALAAAQGKLEDAKKDGANPAFKSQSAPSGSRYATLASVRAALSAVLPEFGLAVVQTFEPHGDDGVCVVTKLLHESGEWVRSSLYLPVSKKDAQGFGSAVTYGRRYSLAAIVGIATDDDDDGNEAVKPPVRKAPPAKTESVPPVAGEAVEAFVAVIDASEDVKSLMTVHARFQADPAVSPAAKTYLTQLCTLKRKKLEAKAA